MGLLGALTFSDLACLSQGAPAAAAATQPTRFVYAWTAFDLLDPHVKYDGNAYFFNLNMYDNSPHSPYKKSKSLISEGA